MTAGDVLVEEPVQADLQDPTFLMYSYKVKPCQKKYRHDWRVCPFAHEGESAARRDPRRHKYVGVACPYAKQGKTCPRGQGCPCTHNVFEYWLHPTRFRTEICSQGTKCNRSCCFFAHTDSELRKLKHQDIINSAVGDPNETCDALESYLKKTSTSELNDADNDSESRDSTDDAVIIMGSVPKTEDEVSSDGEEVLVMGVTPQGDVLRNSPEQVSLRYSPGAVRMVSAHEHSSYHPSVQVSRAIERDGSFFDGNIVHRQYCQNGVKLRNSPDTLLVQDMYMASPEPTVVMGRDGQAHLVSMGDPALKVQDHPRAPLNPYPRSGALSPYGAHLSAGMQLNGFQQTGQVGRRSPPQSPPLVHGGLVHEDNLVNLASDYSQLSRSWKLNRGVSFPSLVKRDSQLGGGIGLPTNSTVQMGGNDGDHLNSGATMDDKLSLRDEVQRLSASWGINRGATLPSLHPTTRSYPYIQNELQQLSDTWGIKRDDFYSNSLAASLKNLQDPRDISTNGLHTFNSLDKFTGYQKDCHFDSLGALQQEACLSGFQGHLSPPPGDIMHGSVSPAEFSSLAASWGLGRNESSLSDSFALTSQEHVSIGDGAGLRPGLAGPPPGFGPVRASFDLPENAPVSDLSILGSEGVGAYTPAGRLVGRNWTFGGNGRVV